MKIRAPFVSRGAHLDSHEIWKEMKIIIANNLGLYVSRGAHGLPNNANLNKAQTNKQKNNNNILIITIGTSFYNNFKPCKTY